jgi:hypothetical protein
MSETCQTGNCNVTPEIWGGRKVDITDLDVKDASHPNVSPFTGTLLRVDEASDQAPHGSDGHRIFVSKEAAEKQLATLPGMGINYQKDLTGHNPTQKVGVITKAWIDGDKVKVEGNIWKKDFPEAARTFKANRGRLGMSMELGDVYVRDKDEDVWHLEDFRFTGATVLLKNHAAYERTELAAQKYFVNAMAAAKAASGVFSENGGTMAEKDKKENAQSQGQVLVTAISAALGSVLKDAFDNFSKKQDEANQITAKALKSVSASQEELVKGLHELALNGVDASAEVEDVDAEAEEVEEVEANADATMTSGKSHDATDATDATDVDAEVDPTSYTSGEQDDTGSGATPGDLNPNTDSNYNEQSKGAATSRLARPGGKEISRGIAARKGTVRQSMAAAKAIRSLTAQLLAERKDKQQLKNRLASVEASLERYVERVERKSISPEISALLEKSGYDVREMLGSRQRLSVHEVDEMLAKSGVTLDPANRMAFKNQLLQNGLMEQGEVKRLTH